MKNILLIVSVISCGLASAQDFAIKRVELAGPAINVYYDLLDSVTNRTYSISLFSSKDNFISPMEKVSGDLGLEVRPGQNKKITWNAKEELGSDFEGKVSLEVRGRIYIPFVKLDQLSKSIKRLKNYELTWTGGTQQNILNFELYRNEEKVTTVPNIANVGHYTLNLKRDVKAGSNYYFKITDSKNKDQVVITPYFKVKSKTPFLLKAILAGGIGAVGAILLNGHKTTTSTVPDAPGHP